jgi:glycosyltransferase involved in cell wall biosynthesis
VADPHRAFSLQGGGTGLRAMRVIFAASSLYRGGAERHAICVLNRLADRGHECHAVAIKDLGDTGARIVGAVTCLDAARYLDARAVGEFAACIARVRPAVIVAANPYALMYSRLAAHCSGVRTRLAVTFHTTLLQSAKERLQMLCYRPFFWAADLLVFVCEKQRRHWLARGVFSRRNVVIHNGVDTEQFRAVWTSEERSALRRSLGLLSEDYVIGIAALLRPEKNHVQLVEAVAALRKRGIRARVLMIGDGEMRGAIEARARALGVADSVTITGFQSDVRPYIGACDVMALCSVTETFSLAAIEAMALGKPVVHSDVGGAAEMIIQGKNGFLFPVGNTRAFVNRLAILADPAVSRVMGDNARALVESRFSEKTMVDRYERLLLDLSGSDSATTAAAMSH